MCSVRIGIKDGVAVVVVVVVVVAERNAAVAIATRLLPKCIELLPKDVLVQCRAGYFVVSPEKSTKGLGSVNLLGCVCVCAMIFPTCPFRS